MTLDEILAASAALHKHLCPRQVLGARMGMLAGIVLGLDLPRDDKRLLAIVETDGCFVDGLSVATGCTAGHRTLRVEDYGKVAATFVDARTEQAVRLAPSADSRLLAPRYAPEARNKWEAQLLGYQRVPDDQLFSVQAVRLKTPVAQIVSRPGLRAACDLCGEEIINGREVEREGLTVCRACAGEAYYALPMPAWPSALQRLSMAPDRVLEEDARQAAARQASTLRLAHFR
jgi:formylmethanofuran dehydrogenase subunit E